MRTIDRLLIGAALVAGGAVGFGSTASSRAAERSRPAPQAKDVRASLQVHEGARPRTSPQRVLTDVPSGTVAFDLGEPEKFRGLSSALLFPDRNGAPDVANPMDVGPWQSETGLDLRGWEGTRDLRGERQWLHAVVVYDGPGGFLYHRSVWARITTSDLLSAGIAIVAERGEEAWIFCRTQEGAAVPGALLTVDAPTLARTLATILVTTDDQGVARVSGLRSDTAWTVAPFSRIGPFEGEVRQTFRIPNHGVDLRVPLGPGWTFRSMPIGLQARGEMLQVEDPRLGADGWWAVAPGVLPGRGPVVPFWAMSRRGPVPTSALEIRFQGREPLRIEPGDLDATEPLRPVPRRAPPR